MTRSLLLPAACALLLAALLAACGHAAPDDDEAAAPPGQVAVTTATPTRQTFHDTVEAWGSVAGDPQRARAISLGHGGQVSALLVAAGQTVKRGQALLTITPDPAAHSTWLQAQTALTLARGELQRSERLAAQRLATQSQLAAARKALADAQATLDAQAKLGGAQTMTTLRAPADGVVTTLAVQRGARVAAGAALLQLAPASTMEAQLGIDPGALADIRAGMPVTLTPVYAGRAAPSLHGTVAMVGDAVDPQSHMVDVIATLDDRVSLPAGTALSGTILASPFTAWAIPRNALQNDERGDFVFQIERGKAKRIDVTVLAPNGSPVGVQGALDARAPVITLGSHEVSDGDPVRTSAPASNASQGTGAR